VVYNRGITTIIILDNGTTTLEIARHLKTMKLQNLTVITNALNIASELALRRNLKLFVTGGAARPVSFSWTRARRS